jgi:hypothetical protein
VKNRRKTFGIEEKLDVISWLEKCERIVDKWCHFRLVRISMRTIRGNAGRIKESIKPGTEVFV